MKNKMKVAGVTFCNNNGVSRQEILKAIGIGFKTAKLRQTVFEGERAVEVRIGGLLIGYIKKMQLSNQLSYERELTAYIGCMNNKYYCELTERERPSSVEYQAMKAFCYQNSMPMPAYDRRAYVVFYTQNLKGELAPAYVQV